MGCPTTATSGSHSTLPARFPRQASICPFSAACRPLPTDAIAARSQVSGVRRANTDEPNLYQKAGSSASPLPAVHARRTHASSSSTSNIPTVKRKPSFQLPSLPLAAASLVNSAWHIHPGYHSDSFVCGHDSSSMPATSHVGWHADARPGTAPLLTPPPDDESRSAGLVTVNSGAETTRQASGGLQSDPSPTARSTMASTASRSPVDMTTVGSPTGENELSLQHGLWTSRVSQIIVTLLSSMPAQHYFQVISQALPSQARDSQTKPTFEDILEQVQLRLDYTPFITITHGVPQARTIEELPKSPPSTPRPAQNSEDYFGGEQTIFTHAAAIPIYHYHPLGPDTLAQPPHKISAPTIQISILERYIPPTMPEEIRDFFDVSSTRSYLGDRLSELSSNCGSLVLVYPTRVGGTTFAQKYIGPVFDPFLRQFVLLNNLTSDAAAALGTMPAVESMITYEEMVQRVQNLCHSLTHTCPARTAPSQYVVSYREKTEVVLDRATWMHWFVEQESARLRRNLTEYHQSGGRMPDLRDNQETTVGMLTREVIEGLQRTPVAAGGVGIEVGVFVITRSRFS